MPDDEAVKDRYDETYFMHGLEKGVSAYTNYHWLPEKTCSMAMSLIDHLPIRPEDTCLDFGAARGFLVHSLRILNRFCWGADVSRWAVANCHPEAREFMAVCDGRSIPWNHCFRLVICKDVLEHVPRDVLPELIEAWAQQCERCFVIVPLGDGERFISGIEEMDQTHSVREPLEFWTELLGQQYEIESAELTFPGIKAEYGHITGAHGFIHARRAW